MKHQGDFVGEEKMFSSILLGSHAGFEDYTDKDRLTRKTATKFLSYKFYETWESSQGNGDPWKLLNLSTFMPGLV